MSLQTNTLNQSLAEGYTSPSMKKDGQRSTIVAVLSDTAAGIDIKLQQSVDGSVWSDIPDSETTTTANQTEIMWNEDVLPMGAQVRLVATSGNSTLVSLKMLAS